ncbi:MAG: hypothetical protein IT266_06585 [Saprospiraceae bacterium]|nr:hypothetical protein [Saprospiraceae bacterium]
MKTFASVQRSHYNRIISAKPAGSAGQRPGSSLRSEGGAVDLRLPPREGFVEQVGAQNSKNTKTQYMNQYLTMFSLKLALLTAFLIAGLRSASATEQFPGWPESLELRFSTIQCKGKDVASPVLYTAETERLTYFFMMTGFAVRLPEIPVDDATGGFEAGPRVELQWEGLNPQMDIVGADEFKARKSSIAVRDCVEKQYRKLYYNQLYPGIDLMYADRADQLEMDFYVEAGFDYRSIQFRADDAAVLTLGPGGKLQIRLGDSVVAIERPLVVQDGKPLAANWELSGQQVSLHIPSADPERALRIQTFLGNALQRI